MMAYPDGSPGAERASQHCQQQQGALGNAPGVAAGTLFIHSKNDQRQQIDQQQIDGESCDMLAEKKLDTAHFCFNTSPELSILD